MKEKRIIILAVFLLILVGVYVWYSLTYSVTPKGKLVDVATLPPDIALKVKISKGVDAYQKEQGRVPQNLDELKGKYLEPETIKLAKQKDFRYERVSPQAYRIASPKLAAPVQVAAKPPTPAEPAPAAQPAPAGQKTGAPAAAPTAVEPGATPTSLAEIAATYDPKGKADPFKPFLLTQKASTEGFGEAKRKPLTPLQKMALSEIQAGLRAIIWGKMGNKALVEDATGKGYVLAVGTYVGQNDGIVKKILEDRIVVEEYIRDPVENRLTTNEVVLKLKKVETEE
jgi:type IV pilus assembly protein PilP